MAPPGRDAERPSAAVPTVALQDYPDTDRDAATVPDGCHGAGRSFDPVRAAQFEQLLERTAPPGDPYVCRCDRCDAARRRRPVA